MVTHRSVPLYYPENLLASLCDVKLQIGNPQVESAQRCQRKKKARPFSEPRLSFHPSPTRRRVTPPC
jgi:hypothetical protein